MLTTLIALILVSFFLIMLYIMQVPSQLKKWWWWGGGGVGGFLVNFIPENIISDIQTAAKIEDIVSEVVVMEKTGKDFQGLCPFHSEKTPSFTVSPSKQIFYCFGCGTGGNVFNFLMKYQGMTFPEAVKKLAQRYGIGIPDHAVSPEQKQKMYEREQLIRINKEAAYFFYNELKQNRANKEASAYLSHRGIKQEIIDKFLIGFAPQGWNNLLRFLSNKGFSPGIMHKAGLVIPKKSNTGYYDRFRNRIIFPIINIQGQIIGFGGRVMDNSLPKYLNSPETPLFNKSRTLYGINTARQKSREDNLMYMTEGYFDVISLYSHGIKNAVASLGTALTDKHVRLLKGIVQQVILVFDSDQAGIRAATRSIEIFRKQNMGIKILILPQGYDPDSFICEFNSKKFREKAENAKSAISFLTDEAVKKHGMSIEARLRIIEDMKKPLASINDPVARSLYIRALAVRLCVDETMLSEKIRQTDSFQQPTLIRHPQTHNIPEPAMKIFHSKQFHSKHARMEKKIISMMLQFHEILPEIKKRDILDYFEDPLLKSLGLIILSKFKGRSGEAISDIINIIEDKEEQSIEGCLGLLAQFESGTGYKRRSNNLLQ